MEYHKRLIKIVEVKNEDFEGNKNTLFSLSSIMRREYDYILEGQVSEIRIG